MECPADGDPKTGAASAKCELVAGDEKVNARAGFLAETNSHKERVSQGVFAATKLISNNNEHNLSVERVHAQGRGESTTLAAQANIFKDDKNKAALNATAFHTRNPTHDHFGGGLNLEAARGQSASLNISHVPQNHQTTMSANGRVNLFSSPSGNLNLGATANASRQLSGPFRGNSNIGGGLDVKYVFK